ncbi:hypothetical protein PQO01_21295 [Lentisphaera marina]|uniref:hypothetical protein n=1 Tax=Lentisphaera marina TaxID=1111041 RepID=UPI002366E802|nr:hypothetical protein [Lentisphaera marina]MDD7987497.1 hypothetical protein [Lentisphaera marina]
MLRQLSPTEHSWQRVGELDSNNFMVIAELSGALDEGQLHDSLIKLIQSQAILSYDLGRKGDKLFFVQGELEDVPLESFSVSNKDERNYIVDQCLNSPINSCPFWHLKIISIGRFQHSLVLTFNHMLADGRTGVQFFDYLLRSITDPNYEIPQSEPIKSFEHSYSQQKDVMQTLKTYSWGIKNKFARKALIPNSVEPKADDVARTAYVSKRMDSAQLNKILSFSRLYKGSFTSTLVAVFLSRISEKYDLHKPLHSFVAVDTRPYANDSDYQALNYAVGNLEVGSKFTKSTKISTVSHYFKSEFIEKCTPIQFAFDKFVRSMALKKFPEAESFLEAIQDNQNAVGLVTNIGVTNLANQYGAIKVQQCYHVPATHLVKKPFYCLSSATHDHELILNLSYPAHLIDRGDADDLLNSILDALQNLA